MNNQTATYSYPLSVTSQFSFCGLPFRLDTYGGCSFGCSYCFARLRGGNTESNRVKVADANSIIKVFQNATKYPERTKGVVSECIRQRVPVHFGGMSDPFQPIERRHQVSLRVLEFLSSVEYPTVISTKSPLIAEEPYLSILAENPNVLVQFSFSTLRDNLSEISEPVSTKPSVLMKTVYSLSKRGINTSVRWQPFIPGLSEKPSEFVTAVASVGTKHLGFEHLKLPLEKERPLWKRMRERMSFDIQEFYRDAGSIKDGREMVLPTEHKIDRVLEVKGLCRENEISFGCADNELQYLSDSDCCCSGADLFEGFENWFKYQIGYAVKKSNGGKVEFSLIENEWKPNGSIDKHMNSKSRRLKGAKHNTIQDYILDRWEDENSPFNPSNFHGLVWLGERDMFGRKVYSWKNSHLVEINSQEIKKIKS